MFDGAATAFAAISISAPTSRIVHADTGELGGLLCPHSAEVSAALGDERPTTGADAGRDAAPGKPSSGAICRREPPRLDRK